MRYWSSWLALLAGCASQGSERKAAKAEPPAALPATATSSTPVEPDAASAEAKSGDASGVDATSSTTAEASPAPAALPKKCAADSPTDVPCSTYGGTYLVSLRPRDGVEHCHIEKPVQARFELNGANRYRGDEQAQELGRLARALGLARADLRVGSAVRDGVCCVDVEVSTGGVGAHRRVRVRIARGESIVNAKASERVTKGNAQCDAELDVTVELVDR